MINLRGLGAAQDNGAFGCLSWPACSAGGTLCPEPDSFGASLNPCCHFAPPSVCGDSVPPVPNSDGSYGVVGAATDLVTGSLSAPWNPLTSGVPVWVWALAGVVGFAFVSKKL